MNLDPPELAGVIFDLDGTLADTIPVAFDAFRAALAPFVHRRYSDEELRSFFGPSEDGILRRIVPHDWAACLERYLLEYETRHDACPAPFPGIPLVLDLLRDQEVPVGLVTGKVSRAVTISLQRLGIADRFDVIEPGSPDGDVKAVALERIVKAWRIDGVRVAYVGDTPSDMIAAANAGLLPVGAAWDSRADGRALRLAGARVVFDSVDALAGWLRDNLRTHLTA